MDLDVGGSGHVPTHMHVHAHVCMCIHKEIHIQELQMAATMEVSTFIMFNMCACVCTHA